MSDLDLRFEEQEFPQDIHSHPVEQEVQLEVEEPKVEEKPKRGNSKKVDVKRVIMATVDNKWLVQKVDDDTKAYLIPLDVFERSSAVTVQTVSYDILEEVYDFEEEIEYLLPSRDEMIKNVRRALWESGYTTREKLAAKQPNMGVLNRAFPYTFKFVKIFES